MSAKQGHTPGVWQVAEPTGAGTAHRVWRNDEGPLSTAETNTNYACIAMNIHKQADAALIAAAPDMFDALRKIAECGDWTSADSYRNCAKAIAQAAISRARGERT